MAPEIIWAELPSAAVAGVLTVLDPMAGSGTTVATARQLGHVAKGFDTDPLAVLIARAWASDVDEARLMDAGAIVLANAQVIVRDLKASEYYPDHADEETKAFLRYWFDPYARSQLTALAYSIRKLADSGVRDFLWCAFSRMIITKEKGVSLAMDVSHSRPHRSYDRSPRKPFSTFLNAVAYVARRAPFKTPPVNNPASVVRKGDARTLAVPDSSVDWIVTSPPYLNAIDYMRGHRLSLVWMGHRLTTLRHVRSTNVGSEAIDRHELTPAINEAVHSMGNVAEHSSRVRGMLTRYVRDMQAVVSEMSRVLVPGGKALLVVGDSTLKGLFVENSSAIAVLGEACGLILTSRANRALPANKRYLPPPGHRSAGQALEGRMRTEAILKFRKPA